MQLTGLVINVFKHVVVSKTRNGVTGNEKPRNRIFFFFCFFFQFVVVDFVGLFAFFIVCFFQGKRKSLKLFVFGGFVTTLTKLTAYQKKLLWAHFLTLSRGRSAVALVQWVIPEKIHTPPPRWMGSFFNPPLTWISWSTRPPLLSGFPRQKTPLPPGFPEKKY